jgi:hypothetical protein
MIVAGCGVGAKNPTWLHISLHIGYRPTRSEMWE